MVSTIRLNQISLQYYYTPDTVSPMRVNMVTVQYSYYPTALPTLRSNIVFLQDAYYPTDKPELRCSMAVLQYAVRAPETAMSEELFPGSANPADQGRPTLKGMTYNNHARPLFSTKVAEHASGRETATAYWDDPRWEFELSFDWLPNNPGANEDFKTLCGFFLARRGRFESFLYLNSDDYAVTDLDMGPGDGILAEWELYRPYGAFNEPVGQVDTDNLEIYLSGPMSYVIDGVTYDIDVHSGTPATIVVTIGVDTIADVSPAAPANGNQYNRVGDTLTFFSSRAGATAVVNSKVLLDNPTDYTVVMPRTIVFADAPTADFNVFATFEFYYACRFLEDSLDFEQFAHRLWELKEMTLRSIIQ